LVNIDFNLILSTKSQVNESNATFWILTIKSLHSLFRNGLLHWLLDTLWIGKDTYIPLFDCQTTEQVINLYEFESSCFMIYVAKCEMDNTGLCFHLLLALVQFLVLSCLKCYPATLEQRQWPFAWVCIG